MSDENEEPTMAESNQSSDTPPETASSGAGGLQALKNHAMENKVDMLLWLTRALTLVFCFSYFIPIFSTSHSSYQKVLLSNAATSALRLHQRIPRLQLNLSFFTQLFLEDSAHYLLYSLIFIYTAPVTIALCPVVLFALLHFSSYTLLLLDVSHQSNAIGSRFLISLVEFQQQNILRWAAATEIMLMPISIFFVFSGRASLMTPLIYYRFVKMRYASRRNPYTRNMFTEFRLTAEYLVNKPMCPEVIRSLTFRAIGILCSFAPVIETNQQ